MTAEQIRESVLSKWTEADIADEEAHIRKLESTLENVGQDLAAIQEREEILQEGFDLTTPAPVSVAIELSSVSERRGRLEGKYDKVHRDLTEARDRVARWKALRKWAGELNGGRFD